MIQKPIAMITILLFIIAFILFLFNPIKGLVIFGLVLVSYSLGDLLTKYLYNHTDYWRNYFDKRAKKIEKELLEEEERRKEEESGGHWPTREMYDRYYRTGNRRYLYDEDYRG